jgi:hypothetical protein
MEVLKNGGVIILPLNSMNSNLKVTLKINYKFLLFIKYILYLAVSLAFKKMEHIAFNQNF